MVLDVDFIVLGSYIFASIPTRYSERCFLPMSYRFVLCFGFSIYMFIPMCLFTCTPTYIHTYLHTYIYIYIYVTICLCVCLL